MDIWSGVSSTWRIGQIQGLECKKIFLALTVLHRLLNHLPCFLKKQEVLFWLLSDNQVVIS